MCTNYQVHDSLAIVHDHARWKRINTLELSDVTTLRSPSKLPKPPELSTYSSLIHAHYSRSWIRSSPLLPFPLPPSLLKRRRSKYQLIKSTRITMVATVSSHDGHPLRMFRVFPPCRSQLIHNSLETHVNQPMHTFSFVTALSSSFI